MREIKVKDIALVVENMLIDACQNIPENVLTSLKLAKENEKSPLGKEVIQRIVDNDLLAREKCLPICQDTGVVVCFVKVGYDVHFDGDLYAAINEGVANAYTKGYLRKSVVKDPLNRINTNDNTPAIIHTKVVNGDKIKITVAPKGFGSENMSAIKMLTPAASRETIIESVLEIVKSAGANPCPPMVIGIGIGGDFEMCAYLAKKALCRENCEKNTSEFYRLLENEILERVNALNIGPQGFGGKTTALKVNIEQFPTHIAGLPLAVNIGCHVTRHKSEFI